MTTHHSPWATGVGQDGHATGKTDLTTMSVSAKHEVKPARGCQAIRLGGM